MESNKPQHYSRRGRLNGRHEVSGVKPARNRSQGAHVELPDRKHPWRLRDESYRAQHRPVLVTLRTRDGRTTLVPQLAQMVAEVLFSKAERFGISLHGYCIMPDHMHFVCSPRSTSSEFEKFIMVLKREVSRRAHREGRPEFAWQRSYWDRHARVADDVRGMMEYVLANPVRKGLCDTWEDWPWARLIGSSAESAD